MDENIYLQINNSWNFDNKSDILKKFKIFGNLDSKIRNFNFNFNIIGYSHCIFCKELNFLDVFSGTYLDFLPLLKSYSLKGKNFTEKIIVNSKIEVIIELKKLDTIYRKENYNLSYLFENLGFTGIRIYDNFYETIHTYPEFDSEILTKVYFK